MIAERDVAAAFIAACHDELAAPKPGNVHEFAAGHGMVADEFKMSAAAAAGPLAVRGARVGQRVRGAIDATFAAVGKNTNLGIVLLCAPLAAAAEQGPTLRDNMAKVLRTLDRSDTANVFAAIRRAQPAGLGSAARHDVRGAAEADLATVMQEGAAHDRIALQYAANFHDVFMTGQAALADARARGFEPPWSTVFVYLTFLAAFPDTHIIRKCGSATAAMVQAEGRNMLALFAQKTSAALPELLALDAELKALNRNPGTSADLTVATLFADRLYDILLRHRNDG